MSTFSLVKNIAVLTMVSMIFVHYFFVQEHLNTVNKTILEQLDGKLSATARQLASLNDQLKLGEAELMTQERLNDMSSTLLKNHQDLQDFMDKTNAELKSYSTRMTSITIQLKELNNKAQVKPASLPDNKDSVYNKCLSNPESCEPLPVAWKSDYEVKGKSILSFNSPNLWTTGFSYDMNLAYNVEVITIGENCDTGAMGNQGVYIKAGYFDKDGSFRVLAEDKLMKGDKGLDPKFILSPNCKISEPGMKTFEPSLFAGVSYAYASKEKGIMAGINVINLLEKKNLRLGGLVNYNKQVGVGFALHYYPTFWNKPLNVAPTFGIVWNRQGTSSFLVGLSFNFW